MKFKDYYKILELDTYKVSNDEVKVAYRKLAKKFHPDINVNDRFAEERFKDINEAYDVLKKNLNKGATYTYQNASAYWSHQSYQGYGYYRQSEAQFINEMKEIKKKISGYFKSCPAEKLKNQVSNLILDYIIKVGRSQNPNLTFINFKIDLEKIYRNYIDIYAQKHKIPSFIITRVAIQTSLPILTFLVSFVCAILSFIQVLPVPFFFNVKIGDVDI
jgi:DnaJ-class molecular chaperone